MSWFDWLIVVIPMTVILGVGFYSRRYIKGVSDFLVGGRVAGRYVLSIGSVAGGLAVISLIGYVEVCYKTGFAMNFWRNILIPVAIVMGLTGFCNYRFRETNSMSLGQFLEMRYNRPLRIYASGLRSFAELLANCMCPALAARFLIYYMDIPYSFSCFGIACPTYMFLVALMVILCVFICWHGGTIALMVTNTLQGFICYPMLLIFTVFILCKFSWSNEIIPVMGDRVAGQSFLNPYDVDGLRDFNFFALIVTLYSNIVNRAIWLGTSTDSAAKTAHEQKMASIICAWHSQFSYLLYILLVLVVITALNHASFAPFAKDVRDTLSAKVLSEVRPDESELRSKIAAKLAVMPPRDHKIGGDRPQDAPLSQERNLDTPHLAAVHQVLRQTEKGEAAYQEFFTLYHQMMLPVTLRKLLPPGLIGLFALFVLVMMLSTDDGRLFSSAQTITQDCIIPFCRKGLDSKQHVRIVKIVLLGCGAFWFAGSFFMAQLDYIQMFTTIICSLWIGAGPMMLFGLYSRFGNSCGAFASLISGMVLSLLFIFLQRNWADLVYPFLVAHQWEFAVGGFLEACSAPLEPWLVWRMSAHKFPINSMEINMIIMLFCLLSYVAASLLTCRKPYNLDRMLHRGVYNISGEKKEKFRFSLRSLFSSLIGITPEFTRGDKIISWSVFFYSIVYYFLFAFVGVLCWNCFTPWPLEWWGKYFFIIYVAVPVVGIIVTMVWYSIGGSRDIKQLFIDLKARVDDPLDNGQVEGNVALSDIQAFSKIVEKQKKTDADDPVSRQ